jgi:hypothetical protein
MLCSRRKKNLVHPIEVTSHYLCRLLFDILPLLIADGGALAAQHLPRPGGTVQECLRHKKTGKARHKTD